MKNVDKWILGKIIGQGGSGNVMECHLHDNSKKYAIKQLKEKKGGRKERFEIEIKTNLQAKDKEDIYKTMPMIDYDKTEYLWYVSEIGTPSISHIKEEKVNPLMILFFYKEFLKGIKELHDAKIFHRDIKADNILFYKDSFRIIDFGIASNEDLNLYHDLTQQYDKNQLGAKYTMAPEMRRIPNESDPLKADIYSLAKTLWSLITHKKTCFDGQYNKINHSLDKYFEIPIINIHLLDNILYKCTSDNIDDRMSINEIIEDIEYIIYINLIKKSAPFNKKILRCRESSNTIIKKHLDEIKCFDLLKLNNSYCATIEKLFNNGTFLYNQTNINNFKDKNIDFLLLKNNQIFIFNNYDDHKYISGMINIDEFTDIYIVNNKNIPFSIFIKRENIYILLMCTNIESHKSDFIFRDNLYYHVPEEYLIDVFSLIRFLKGDVKIRTSLLLQNSLYGNKYFFK